MAKLWHWQVYVLLLLGLNNVSPWSRLLGRSYDISKSSILHTIGQTMMEPCAMVRYQSIHMTLKDTDGKMVNINRSFEKGSKFWVNGLDFECTGCGRCCHMDGDVWLNGNEFAELVDSLRLPPRDVLDCYAADVVGDWVRLKERVIMDPENNNHTGCIFLSEEDDKTCSIYRQRPHPCRTYPFWPHILQNRATWEAEKVQPIESIPFDHSKRLWSPEQGGCEGIERNRAYDEIASVVSPLRILASREASAHRRQKFNFEVLPVLNHYGLLERKRQFDEIAQLRGNHKESLLQEIHLQQIVVNTTRRWIEEFVISFNLCPFAASVYREKKVKYVISPCNNTKEAFFTLCQEALFLLSVPETEVETTLIVFPFLLPVDFMKFHKFSILTEDRDFPLYLAKLREELSSSQGKLLPSSKGFGQTIQPKIPLFDKEKDDLQLAFFHPFFQWHSSDKVQYPSNTIKDDPLNFEKRSPHPTINILRSSKIKGLANEAKTKRIGDQNQKRLKEAGSDTLREKMLNIIQSSIANLSK